MQSLLELLVYGGYKTPPPPAPLSWLISILHNSLNFSDLAVCLFYSCWLQFLFQVSQPTKTPVLVGKKRWVILFQGRTASKYIKCQQAHSNKPVVPDLPVVDQYN